MLTPIEALTLVRCLLAEVWVSGALLLIGIWLDLHKEWTNHD